MTNKNPIYLQIVNMLLLNYQLPSITTDDFHTISISKYVNNFLVGIFISQVSL